MDKNIIVTGCAGFIGSHFTVSALKKGFKVIGIDKLSYASDLAFLETLKTAMSRESTDVPELTPIICIYLS